MDQSFAFYVEEVYNRSYYLFLAANNLRQVTSSSYLTDLQKEALGKPTLEQIILESEGLTTRAEEIHAHFFPPEL